MSLEHIAALLGCRVDQLEEKTVIEEFECLDGTIFKAPVVYYEKGKEALLISCKKFYANKIKRATSDEMREKIMIEYNKRMIGILRRN